MEEKFEARPKSFTPEKEANEDIGEKKKPAGNFGRKNLRERKVTIVTALSGMDERTRSLAAYKRSKQKTKKSFLLRAKVFCWFQNFNKKIDKDEKMTRKMLVTVFGCR